MGSLRLLEQLADEVRSTIVQPLTLKQLRVPQDRRQRVIQLMRDTCDQLPTADIFSLCNNCSCVRRRSS